MARTQVNLEDFPDSPYAHELQRGAGTQRFAVPLEVEYNESHLQRVHFRTRAWFTLSMLLSSYFTYEQLQHFGLHNVASILHLVAVMPACIALVWLSWSAQYKRHFLACSRVLVPVYSTLIAVFVAQGIQQGRVEQLSGLTVDLIAVFFFAGLKYRQALWTASIMLVCFLGACVGFDLASGVIIKATIIVGLTSFIGIIVAQDIERSYRKSFLESALIGELAARDGLTGVMNRRTFDEHLLRVWQHALRDRRSMAVLMIDIDHFKLYNDLHGHQAGDAALRCVARAIQEFARRPLDLAARFGGEEFAVILYDLPPTHVNDIAERIRSCVQGLRNAPGMLAGPIEREVTVSVGVGFATPTIGRTPQGAVQLADEALYAAKRAGRNCVVTKGSDEYCSLDTGSFRTAQAANT